MAEFVTVARAGDLAPEQGRVVLDDACPTGAVRVKRHEVRVAGQDVQVRLA